MEKKVKKTISYLNYNYKYEEMKYTQDRYIEPKILLHGTYKGYKFYVLSLGTHPTAYVEIPSKDILYNMDYNDLYDIGVNIPVHGGLTFSGKLHLAPLDERYFLGWDYSHYGDFIGYDLKFNFKDFEGRKWKVKDIFMQDVTVAIEEIIKANKPLSKLKIRTFRLFNKLFGR